MQLKFQHESGAILHTANVKTFRGFGRAHRKAEKIAKEKGLEVYRDKCIEAIGQHGQTFIAADFPFDW